MRISIIIFTIIVASLAIALPFLLDHSIKPTPIGGLIDPSSPLSKKILESRNKNRKDKPFGSHPDKRETQHPFTAAAGRAGIHADAAASDVHEQGPNGQKKSLKLISRVGSKFPGGMCATLTFNKKGYLIALCASLRRFELHMFEPKTLKLLTMFPLPNRPSTFAMLMTLDPTKIMLDTSGGAYYYLDNEDRVVLADAKQQIRRIGHRQKAQQTNSNSNNNNNNNNNNNEDEEQEEEEKLEFYDESLWDVGFMIPQDCMTWNNWFPSKDPEACDPITAVIPDFEGNIWFVTRRGIVGVLDPKQGIVIASTHLHEEMQNGLTAGEDGVWIVTDKALYCMRVGKSSSSENNNNNKKKDFKPRASTDGVDGTYEIKSIWSATYDRGTYRKVGMLSVGSGTTPTLFDGRYVTITDNRDEPTIQLLVYDLEKIKKELKNSNSNKKNSKHNIDDVVKMFKTSDAPLVCEHGLFKKDNSASDNSMIAVDGSIFMENNMGYHNAIQQQKWGKKQLPGGIVRVDLQYQDDKEKQQKTQVVTGCKTVWESTERAPSCVAKLGQKQGLLYYYTLEDENDFDGTTAAGLVLEDDDSSSAVGGILTTLEWIFDAKKLFDLVSGGDTNNNNNKKNDKKPPRPFWAVTAVDAHTGKTVFKVPTGRGRSFDNNWGPVTLGPDGTLYVGVIRGIIAIYDE